MKTIMIEIPDELAHAAGASDEDVARDARLALAILWYDRGMISLGKGTEIAGLTRAEFIDEFRPGERQCHPDQRRGIEGGDGAGARCGSLLRVRFIVSHTPEANGLVEDSLPPPRL